jgi:ribosomal protein S18 acetylase RimI-like enzyme
LNRFIKTTYFRLVHRHINITPQHLPDGFKYAKVEKAKEAVEIANFLNRCYPNINQQPKKILSWGQTPIFCSILWIWIKETVSGQPTAFGIADFDPTTKEGSLEWIQAHPQYRRKKLGASVVNELLSRLSQIADFSTVSGRVDNATRPDILYRKCDFEGADIWWILTRNA